jgi:hypothetical protein
MTGFRSRATEDLLLVLRSHPTYGAPMARDEEKDEGAETAEETTPSAKGDEGEAPAEAEPRPKATRSRKARRDGEGRDAKTVRPAGRQRSKPSAAQGGAARLALVGVVALAAGLAAGWFGHAARAKAKLQESAGPTAVDSGHCQQWEEKICAGSGEESMICQQAKSAAELLTPPICESALNAVPATLAKAKAARASCDTLIGKACNDLPKGSSTCKMVQERTGSFPVDRCKEMLEQYEQVIEELRAIEAQGGPEMENPGQGQGMPPGMPPADHP